MSRAGSNTLAVVRISRALLDELIAHARDEAPNECCGLIGTRDGQPESYYRIRNEYESPMRFLFHRDDLPEVNRQAEERDELLSIVYHSHPRTEARPSQTDINLAGEMAGWFPGGWLICSLAGADPIVRAFEITEGEACELELSVVG